MTQAATPAKAGLQDPLGLPAPPLVVDLDGTLIRSDTLVEMALRAIHQSPATLLLMLFWLIDGKARLKEELAHRVALDPQLLPYNEPLLDYLRLQRRLGRELVLATAANHRVAASVAGHLGLFSSVIASSSTENRKGHAKLDAIRSQIGPVFAYAGDSTADTPIWRAASAALVIDAPASLARTVLKHTPIEWSMHFERAGWRAWARQLRLHQWLKNLLIFVALLTSFTFTEPARLAAALLAFLSFSMAASATYIFNDLWDLDSDRSHPRKKSRPLASGSISIPSALLFALCLLAASVALSWLVNSLFVGALLIYIAVTGAYSWHLKRYVLVDVLTIASLFTLRIAAGAAAISVAVSNWLLAFSIFIFFSLALVKRCSELVSLEKHGRMASHGRDYRQGDLAVLWPLGAAAAMASIVVLGLFINSPDVRSLYATPQLLWLMALALMYWLGRVWIKTARGEMNDDPLVYAATDRASLLIGSGMVAVLIAARYLGLG